MRVIVKANRNYITMKTTTTNFCLNSTFKLCHECCRMGLWGSIIFLFILCSCTNNQQVRERISINDNWKFYKYESTDDVDNLIYDVRPEEDGMYKDSKDADSKPTEAIALEATQEVLKPWIMPCGNDFIQDKTKHYTRPEGNPGSDFPFVQSNFDDSQWKTLNLPHDWAIVGPFQESENSEVGGGMGRLPSNGIAWYRKKITIDDSDNGKSIFLDIDGAMSYAMVWLNGNLVGGWPYGYNSFRLNLTPYVKYGEENQLAIRIDNPNNSARWYPGGGMYRNVWLVKTNAVHVSQWGTYVTTADVLKEKATVNLEVSVDNNSGESATVEVITHLYELNSNDEISTTPVAQFESIETTIDANSKANVNSSVVLDNPKLWGSEPTQTPNRYVAVTTVKSDGKILDKYETKFGVRSIKYDSNSGIYINGELVKIYGVNQHHDLGALGAAWNTRAAERQLEILKEMGCNAIRLSHNPPAPELLELTDKMGFLVMDEVFDVWERKKTPLDFHLIFPEWYEQDLRSMIRRDKNHPSIIMWSYGNEVGEQYTDVAGAEISERLKAIAHSEDPTRLTTASMNWAKPDFPFAKALEVISLNYQGEGIRQDSFFDGVNRIRTKPLYDDFHKLHPNKVVLSSETATAASSRGIYLFPVSEKESSPIRDGMGGDSEIAQVSSYEMYAVDFGSTVDKVFRTIDSHLFVAGEFVWNGFDYIGEPTPYYQSRSSYTGMIDLAGFPKDRYFLYQSKWRPDYPMVHILPHWNWPDRVGLVTPVHVFTSGDEAELFLNGKSLGRKKKGEYEYRLRWNDVVYEPGELRVVAYKNGEKWAEQTIKTTEAPAQLAATADCTTITANGKDLSFITVDIHDENGLFVANATNEVEFSVDGPGEIIATDNGDSYCMVEFPSLKRPAFSGKVLAIVRSIKNQKGTIVVTAKSDGLKDAKIEIITE